MPVTGQHLPWIVFAFGGVVLLSIAGGLLPGGPAKALVKLLMLTLMGVGMSIYGMVTVVGVSRAPRVNSGGIVENVTVSHGKGAHTRFDLAGPEGLVELHLPYSGGNITEGDEAVVSYVGGYGNVTHIQMLSGPYRGWSTTGDDGTVGGWFAFGVGIVLVVIAFWNNARYPDGVVPGRRWF